MRITRDRYLTPEEAERYRKIREQIAAELPDIIDRHQQRLDELSAQASTGDQPAEVQPEQE